MKQKTAKKVVEFVAKILGYELPKKDNYVAFFFDHAHRPETWDVKRFKALKTFSSKEIDFCNGDMANLEQKALFDAMDELRSWINSNHAFRVSEYSKTRSGCEFQLEFMIGLPKNSATDTESRCSQAPPKGWRIPTAEDAEAIRLFGHKEDQP